MRKVLLFALCFAFVVSRISGEVKTNQLNLGITGGSDADDAVTISRPSASVMSLTSGAGTFTLSELAAAAGTTTRTGLTRKSAIQGAHIVAAGNSNVRFSNAGSTAPNSRSHFGSWPQQMEIMTQANPLLWDTSFFHEGVNGEKSTDGWARFDDIMDHTGSRGDNDPDILILAYGTNDIILPASGVDPATFIEAMTSMTQAAISSGTVPVIFNIPDMLYGSIIPNSSITDDTDLDNAIASFNTALENMANANEVAYFDLNELLGEATESASASTNRFFLFEQQVPAGGIFHMSFAGQRHVAVEGLNFLQTHGLVNSNNSATRVDILRHNDPRISLLNTDAASTTNTKNHLQLSDSSEGTPIETSMLINLDYREIDNDSGGDIDVIQLTFLGTGIAAVFFKADTGIIDITLDSDPEVEVDTFGSQSTTVGEFEAVWQTIVWQKRDLDFSTHTLTIEAKNTRNASATSNRLLFAGLLVERGSMNAPIVVDFPTTVTAPAIEIQNIATSDDVSAALVTVTGDATASPRQEFVILDADVEVKKTGANDLFNIDQVTGHGGFGTPTPGLNVGTSAGDYPSAATVLHVSETVGNAAAFVVEGALGSTLDAWARNGAANDKAMRYQVTGGIAEFYSLNDDTTERTADIFIMDMGLGWLGQGTATPGENAGSASGDYAATNMIFHNRSATSQASLLVLDGGQGSILDMWDRSGGANDKAVRIQLGGGQFEIQAIADNLATFTDNVFVADLGTGNIAMGNETSPTVRLLVSNGVSSATVGSSTDLMVEDDDVAQIQISAPTTAAIIFGDKNSNIKGRIFLDNASETLTLLANEAVRINSSGDTVARFDLDGGAITFNENNEDVDFEVQGGTGSALFVDADTEDVGVGIATPGTINSVSVTGRVLNVTSAASHGRLVSQGALGGNLYLVDTGGAANDKILQLKVDAGIVEFNVQNDAFAATQTDNILVMDLGSGHVATGTAVPGTPIGASSGYAAIDSVLQSSTATGSGAARLIADGEAGAAVELWHQTAGANDKAILWLVSSGTSSIQSLNDDRTENESNIISMDLGTGNVGINIVPATTVAGAARLAVVGGVQDDSYVFAASFDNSGDDDVDMKGISIQAGQDDGSTDNNIFIEFFDGNGASLGQLDNAGGSGPGFGEISDARRKKDIANTVRDNRGIVKRLKIRDFRWKGDKTNRTHVGVIAQEVEEILPIAVVERMLWRRAPDRITTEPETAIVEVPLYRNESSSSTHSTTYTLLNGDLATTLTTTTLPTGSLIKGERYQELTKMIRPGEFTYVLLAETQRQQREIELLWSALSAMALVLSALVVAVTKLAQGKPLTPDDIEALRALKENMVNKIKE